MLKPRGKPLGKVLQHKGGGDRVSEAGEIRARVKAEFGMGDTVHAKAENHGGPVVSDCFRLKQNARQFGAADEKIIRPLQLAKMMRSGSTVDRFGKGNGRQKRKFRDVFQGRRVGQQKAGEQVALRRLPAAAPAAPSLGLFLRRDPELARIPGLCPFKRERVGGPNRFMALKTKARRMPRRAFQIAAGLPGAQKSAPAAVFAASTIGPGITAKKMTKRPDRPSTKRSSIGMASKASAGSSKNMILMMRR